MRTLSVLSLLSSRIGEICCLFLPITEMLQVKLMSNERNEYETKLQLTDEWGEPLYKEREEKDKPLLCHSEFWK